MIAQAKRELRGRLRALRHQAAIAGGAAAAAALARLAADWLAARALDPQAVVAGYVAAGDEIDPQGLLFQLAARGHPLCLPVVLARDAPLQFQRYRPGDRLVSGAYGIPVPAGAVQSPVPDIVLVPLVGFDRRGGRLGQGGGYYDRSLPALRRENPRLLAIGLAFSVQEVASVPRASTDAAVDLVITECAVIEVT